MNSLTALPKCRQLSPIMTSQHNYITKSRNFQFKKSFNFQLPLKLHHKNGEIIKNTYVSGNNVNVT